MQLQFPRKKEDELSPEEATQAYSSLLQQHQFYMENGKEVSSTRYVKLLYFFFLSNTGLWFFYCMQPRSQLAFYLVLGALVIGIGLLASCFGPIVKSALHDQKIANVVMKGKKLEESYPSICSEKIFHAIGSIVTMRKILTYRFWFFGIVLCELALSAIMLALKVGIWAAIGVAGCALALAVSLVFSLVILFKHKRVNTSELS